LKNYVRNKAYLEGSIV